MNARRGSRPEPDGPTAGTDEEYTTPEEHAGMITVTERAAQAIRDSIAAENKSPTDAYLRVSVKGGGCSGLMYQLAIDEHASDTDVVIESGDVRIVVDRKSKLFLLGLTLDYTTGLNGKGFVFSNPNAKATCGCGESFTV
jgi:iron-sulfur cluster assembly protein